MSTESQNRNFWINGGSGLVIIAGCVAVAVALLLVAGAFS